jgi:hypothetical protein
MFRNLLVLSSKTPPGRQKFPVRVTAAIQVAPYRRIAEAPFRGLAKRLKAREHKGIHATRTVNVLLILLGNERTCKRVGGV